MEKCTVKFLANPDVSGIGIFVAFYLQGLINLALYDYSWVLKHFPSKRTKWKEWIDTSLNEFVFGSTAAAYALSIAAFSQLNTISAYHLYLCDTFLSSLCTVTMHSRGLTLFRPQERFNRILGVYFLGNKILLIAIRCVNIYRLSTVWEDADGKCFITFIDGNGNLEERDDAVLWLYISLVWDLLGQLVPALVVWSERSELWAPQNPKAKSILIILFSHIPCAFIFIWNLHWTIKLMTANISLIDGNEFEFGFGQVGALVTLVLSFGRAHISYRENRQQEATASDNKTTTLSDKSELFSSRLPPPVTSSEEKLKRAGAR